MRIDWRVFSVSILSGSKQRWKGFERSRFKEAAFHGRQVIGRQQRSIPSIVVGGTLLVPSPANRVEFDLRILLQDYVQQLHFPGTTQIVLSNQLMK
jgi:hypothetical protein